MLTAGTPRLMTPAEVSAAFGVDPKTVTRWARTGKLRAIRTPGGHRRYHADQVEEILALDSTTAWPQSPRSRR